MSDNYECVRERARGTTWFIPQRGMVMELRQGMYLRAGGSLFEVKSD